MRRAGRNRKGRGMTEQSLAHTRWDCVYHIVWIPKYRRKVMYGEFRREIVEIVKDLVARESGVEIVEGSACPDHIHLCLRIPPKHAVSKVVGRIKGRSSIILHERHPKARYATGRDKTLWARGYYVSTVGLNEEVIKEYIKKQEEGSRFE